MDSQRNNAMSEATRLVREGRLIEAMTVLRRGLPGLSSFAAATRTMTRPNDTQSTSRPPLKRARLGLGGLTEHLRTAPGSQTLGKTAERQAPTHLPEGARFAEYTYSGEAGSRPYKLYIPSGYNDQPIPLVVMLHGCTQSPDDFAAGTRMNDLGEEQTFLVAYPAQTQSANASKCWNWFNARDQKRDQGEPALIAGITREIMRDFAVDADRVYVAGLSAGGAAAAIMGAVYPDIYAAIGVHSGLACGAAADIPSAFTAMRQGNVANISNRPGRKEIRQTVPAIVFHGDRDSTVSSVNGDQVIEQSKAALTLRTSSSQGESQGGIEFTRTIHANENGLSVLEHWLLHGAGHAWSGGSLDGSYTDPRGPDATAEMMRFFLSHGKGYAD